MRISLLENKDQRCELHSKAITRSVTVDYKINILLITYYFSINNECMETIYVVNELTILIRPVKDLEHRHTRDLVDIHVIS